MLHLRIITNPVEFFGCKKETDKIYGLNWPTTKADEVAIVACSTINDTKVATRLCKSNHIWDNIDVSNCESDTFSDLLRMVATYIHMYVVIKSLTIIHPLASYVLSLHMCVHNIHVCTYI